jgi:enoyl-CoA hydratase
MELVLFKKDDGILKVSLNRTSVLNAINSDVIKALESGIKAYIEDRSIKALMLYGEGGCFAAGADIKELASLDEQSIRQFHTLREKTFSLLEKFPPPTIAIIERFALGTGLELALCCDFRIACEGALLGVPTVKLGVVESYEYINRVVRAVGPSQAKKLILSGEKIDARTAFTIGLIEEVTTRDKLFSRTESLLTNMSNNSSYSMKQSKKVIEECVRDPNLFYTDDTALSMAESFKGEDFKEGTRAFIEKRKAVFNNP